jgi:hypothetical protein
MIHHGNEYYKGQHRFEHWYLDNAIYFITARCRDKFPAFQSEAAKSIFWDRFEHYTALHGFVPFVTSLLSNHYHTLGYLKHGRELGPMMRKFHGSVAKLVNDQLSVRLIPFWTDQQNRDYFDGCIRDENQYRRAYRYTLTQVTRSGLDWRSYSHTRVHVELEPALSRAIELKAFLQHIPYPRYKRPTD